MQHRHISVIIPALNEERVIASTLAALKNQPPPFEILVADGHSDDSTREVAARYAHVLRAPRGRARQMNAGAAEAHGDILLFLHADTLLPENGLDLIRHAVDSGAEGGIFRLAFDQWTPLLRFYSFCTRFPLKRFSFGDRGLFVRRDVFEEIGGFRDIPLFEDLELARMLHERGGFTFLEESVITSARRFMRNGPLRQQLRNSYLWLHYVAGTDPEKLKKLYRYE